VAELQATMSAREFARWAAYARIEPIGEDREDLRMAILASTIARCAGNKVRPRDFLPEFWRPVEPDEVRVQNMILRLRTFAQAHNRSTA